MADITPGPPGTLFRTTNWVQVDDADEEVSTIQLGLTQIMSLYMEQKNGGEGGLGFLDASKGTLELTIELSPPVTEGRRRGRGKVISKSPVSIDLVVVQDPSSLRSRSGDTGSVLWRSSLHLARHLLLEHYFPPPMPLFDASKLQSASVLELGAGTGVLAALVAPLCGSYIATDREEQLRLVRRNVAGNAGAVKGNVARIEALDWEQVSTARERERVRGGRYCLDFEVDVVVAVDCIYNEHLVRPLVDTLSVACGKGAVAFVVVELRSSDVLQLFLETWLADPAGWTVVRVGEGGMGEWEGVRGNWVGWVGWVKRE